MSVDMLSKPHEFIHFILIINSALLVIINDFTLIINFIF